MHRILTTALVLYWAAFFGVFAGVSALDARSGAFTAFRMIGAAAEPSQRWGPPLGALFALSFAIIAVLFIWSFVTLLLGGRQEGEELTAVAFAAACCGLALLLALGMLLPLPGAVSSIMLQMVGLLASYAAVRLERRHAPIPLRGQPQMRPAARVLPFQARRLAAGTNSGEVR